MLYNTTVTLYTDTYIVIVFKDGCHVWLFCREWRCRLFGFLGHKSKINACYASVSPLEQVPCFVTNECTLTVAPSLIDMGFAFFPIWLLMLKPILETLQGAAGLPEDSASSSDVRCLAVRLTAAVPSPPTVLQETGLVFTLPSSSCGPAWGKTTHQGEQQLSDRGKIRAIYLLRLETVHYFVMNTKHER